MTNKLNEFYAKQGFCQLNPEKFLNIIEALDYLCSNELRRVYGIFKTKGKFGFYFNDYSNLTSFHQNTENSLRRLEDSNNLVLDINTNIFVGREKK